MDTASLSSARYVELASRSLNGNADVYPHGVLANGRILCKDGLGQITCFEITENSRFWPERPIPTATPCCLTCPL